MGDDLAWGDDLFRDTGTGGAYRSGKIIKELVLCIGERIMQLQLVHEFRLTSVDCCCGWSSSERFLKSDKKGNRKRIDSDKSAKRREIHTVTIVILIL